MELIRKNNAQIPQVRINEGVEYLTYPSISRLDGIVHAFSTRIGGVSEGIYESMNLSFTRGDDEERVRENFRRFTAAIGIEYESVVMSDQTHTTNVRRVTAKDRGNGLTRPKDFFDTDGLITNEPGVALICSFADCVPLFFVDAENKAIGLTHSGWRGTVGRIGRNTIQKMGEEFGSRPENIIAAIGPSICVDCYEVSEDVALSFINEFGDRASEIVFKQKDYYREHGIEREAVEGKYQLDLWKANEIVLTEAGIRPENLSCTNICTCCNPDYLFSHRASHGQRGNLVGALMIK